MVKQFLDFCNFMLSAAPLLTSLAVLTLFFVLAAKSIKKHPAAWYTAFSIPFILVAIPTILRWCGVEMTFSFTRIPILGQILRDYIHMGTFGHPLLVIIMYIGALDPKIPSVKKLMSIRKEMSIISGFAVLTHSLIRVANNFPRSLKYFTNHSEYMENANFTSELGLGITNFSMVLGILMLAIFLPLWITSFDLVHRRMGSVKWKKLQKWSYVLYATLFIHAMGIQMGGMLNPRGGNAPKPAAETTVAVVESGAHGRGRSETAMPAEGERHGGRPVGAMGERTGRAESENVRPEAGRGNPAAQAAENAPNTEQVARQSGGRAQAKGFADIKVSSGAKRWIHIVSLILIYGSYLWLRVRKARKDAKKRAKPSVVKS